MQLLYHLFLSLLCCVLLLSSVLSIQCNEEQYLWPYKNPTQCCNKCPPGQFMTQDPDISCHNQCEGCKGDRYMETYNVKTYCTVCDPCSNSNMERKKNCSDTKNTVCGCEAGYQCKDHPCTMCVKITSTSPTFTTAIPSQPKHVNKDSTGMILLLVITALLFGGIAVIVAIKSKPFLKSCFPVGKSKPLSTEEEVSKPIQEVCEEFQQPLEICIKCE